MDVIQTMSSFHHLSRHAHVTSFLAALGFRRIYLWFPFPLADGSTCVLEKNHLFILKIMPAGLQLLQISQRPLDSIL